VVVINYLFNLNLIAIENVKENKEKMTMKKVTILAAVLTAILISSAGTVNALTQEELAQVKVEIKNAPAAELAATAAGLVAKAQKDQKEEIALEVVKLAIEKNPASAVSVVSSVAMVVPESAAKIAALAAKLVKEQADQIAVAAAKVAPSQSEKIVQAVTAAVPQSAKKVAERVRAASSSAMASSSVTVVVRPTLISGQTVTQPPSTAPAPQPGYDPNRYQSK